MPKAEKGSVKDIGKRIKAKGLQKLKYYCQMCEKQCRDANGFKCHLTSESHLRQMKIFSENAGGFMDSYSQEFETMFLETLRMRHGTSRMNANNVYQEVITDKQHIHMNATMWATLSDFVKYLGKKGKCQVEETERGWYVTFIEIDPSKLARQEALEKRLEAEHAAERALAERMQHQRVEAAKALDRTGISLHQEVTKLQRDADAEDGGSIRVKLGASSSSKKPSSKKKKVNVFGGDDDDDDDDEEEEADSDDEQQAAPTGKKVPASKSHSSSQTATTINTDKRKSSSSDSKKSQHRDDGKNKRQKKEEKPVKPPSTAAGITASADDDAGTGTGTGTGTGWLYKGIVVRIINKKVAEGRYYKRKAVVKRLVDPYTAEVEVLPDPHNNKKNDAHDIKKKKKKDKKKKKKKKKHKREHVDDHSDSDEEDDDDDDVVGDVLRLDQDDLETVIPKLHSAAADNDDGGVVLVRVLQRGSKYRGRRARVVSLDKANYQATLELLNDDEDGGGGGGGNTLLERVEYEDFSSLP